MRSRQAWVSSTGETLLERMRSEACFNVSANRSSELSANVMRDATTAPRLAASHSRLVEDSMSCFTASSRAVSTTRAILLLLVGTPVKRSFSLFLLCATAALAEHYDSSVFGALEWRSIGPQRGGRSIASAGSTSRPNEYYFGAVGGGLWKTADGGTTWKPVTDGQIESSSVGAVAVAESNPDVVYVGMGETELRGNIMQGDGVYKSVDAGKTWKQVGLGDTQAISRIRVDPSNADVVYVSALGHPYGPNAERGVFRSRDGGKTWQKVLFKNDRAGAVDLVIDPHNSKVLFAALWDVYRTSYTLSSGGPLSGLYKSTDGGDTWTEITRKPELPNGIIGKIGVAVASDSNRIYAMVEAEDG